MSVLKDGKVALSNTVERRLLRLLSTVSSIGSPPILLAVKENTLHPSTELQTKNMVIKLVKFVWTNKLPLIKKPLKPRTSKKRIGMKNNRRSERKKLKDKETINGKKCETCYYVSLGGK